MSLFVGCRTELNKLIGKQTQLGAQMNENVVVKEVSCACTMGCFLLIFEMLPNEPACLLICAFLCYFLKELNKVEEGQKVYKLVGPVLALQDADEAKTDVQRRIDFIRAEL